MPLKLFTKMINFFITEGNKLENTKVVLVKMTFNDIQAIKTRINGHDEDPDILDEHFQYFLTTTN